MTIQALGIMKTAFSACVTWTNQLLSAVDGSGVILAAFCIMLVVSLLFIPMRGVAIWRGMDPLSDFTVQATYKGKFSSARRRSNGNGKFSKGSDANAKHRANTWAQRSRTNVRF